MSFPFMQMHTSIWKQGETVRQLGYNVSGKSWRASRLDLSQRHNRGETLPEWRGCRVATTATGFR